MNRNPRLTSSASCISPILSVRPTTDRPRLHALTLTLLICTTLLVAHHPSASAVIKTVCQNGTCDYTTIKGAVDSIPLGPGVTISVQPGTYRERVSFHSKSGTGGSRAAIIATPGTVTIDGSNPLTSWQLHTGSVYYATVASVVPPNDQLWVDDVRYTYVTGAGFDTLDSGEYGYNASNSRLYANVGGDNPGSHATFVSLRDNGFDVDSTNYLDITGFTVLRTSSRGIRVRGGFVKPNESEGVSIKYCTSARNWQQGIYVERAHNFFVNANMVHDNGRHGIFIVEGSDGEVGGNTVFRNNNPLVPGIGGGQAGIKIGQSSDPLMVAGIVVEYNIAYDNEDTGIDLDGCSGVLVRRCLSYGNGDHGFDTNDANDVAFINCVAANNDHDGISVENTVTNVSVHNCILAFNALDGTTLASGSSEDVAELFFDGTGLVSDHNIMWSHGAANFGNNRLRGLVQYNDVLYNDFGAYQATAGEDDSSRAVNPMFADTLTANYQLASASSDAMDRAKSDLTGWSWIDLRGFVAHDNDSIPNRGSGSIPYAEIGAYEYDIKPAAMDTVIVDLVSSSSIHLKWRASGDDGRVGRAPSACLRSSGAPIAEGTFGTPVGNTLPSYPGQWRDTTFSGLPMCTLYYFGLKYGGGNSLWADIGDTARAVTSPIWYQGQWVCDEGLRAGEEFSATRSRSSEGRGPGRKGGAGLTAASMAGGTGPVCVEAVPGVGGLAVRVVALRPEEVPGYGEEGGAGVLYQEPDKEGAWKTQLRYALPEGATWALLAPERPGRWIFLEALSVQGVPSTVFADGTKWQLEGARHSRLGDITTALMVGDQPLVSSAGDTLTAHYFGVPAEDGSLPTGLVVLERPASDAVATRAVKRGRDGVSNLPAVHALHQNQPNPFAGKTTFRIDLPLPCTVKLEVFDLLGRRVSSVVDAWMRAGRHSVDWEGQDVNGSPVRAGTYHYRLTAGAFRAERKLVLLP